MLKQPRRHAISASPFGQKRQYERVVALSQLPKQSGPLKEWMNPQLQSSSRENAYSWPHLRPITLPIRESVIEEAFLGHVPS